MERLNRKILILYDDEINNMNSQGSPASWTEDLPHCSDTGLGEASATQYRPDGSRIESHKKKLDYKVYCKFENNM